MSEPLICIESLTKHYRVHKRPPGVAAALKAIFKRDYTTVRAVEGISFSIGEGDRVGFLGPNGAGKTTTLKMLAGLLVPTSGTVRVAGFEPSKRDADFLRRTMLVMGQKQQLLWDLPPSETFELNRAIYDVSRAEFRQTMDELVTLLEIGDVIAKPTRELSLGERMKCELAAALVHKPKVLFLDEPTIGLDVSMQVVMRDFIKRYNERHRATLLLTSHYMDDVVALCPRIIVIDHGHITFDGPLDSLKQRMRPDKRVTLHFDREVQRSDLESIGTLIEADATRAVLRVSQAEVQTRVAHALASLPIRDFHVEDPPLEEVMSAFFRQSALAQREANMAPEDLRS